MIQGDYDVALDWNIKALDIRKEQLGADHMITASSYNNIAAIHQKQGDYEKSLAWHTKALKICEGIYGTEHPETAKMYHNLAANYHHMGDYDNGLDLFCRSLVAMSNCGLADHPNVDIYGKSLGACFEKSSARHRDFTEWFRERVESFPIWGAKPYTEVASNG
jgi:tetratricopeptide (TPR) repeat protein